MNKLRMLMMERGIDPKEPRSTKGMKAHDKKEKKTMEKKEEAILKAKKSSMVKQLSK